ATRRTMSEVVGCAAGGVVVAAGGAGGVGGGAGGGGVGGGGGGVDVSGGVVVVVVVDVSANAGTAPANWIVRLAARIAVPIARRTIECVLLRAPDNAAPRVPLPPPINQPLAKAPRATPLWAGLTTG